jgi:hypothetical protein
VGNEPFAPLGTGTGSEAPSADLTRVTEGDSQRQVYPAVSLSAEPLYSWMPSKETYVAVVSWRVRTAQSFRSDFRRATGFVPPSHPSYRHTESCRLLAKRCQRSRGVSVFRDDGPPRRRPFSRSMNPSDGRYPTGGRSSADTCVNSDQLLSLIRSSNKATRRSKMVPSRSSSVRALGPDAGLLPNWRS